MIKTTFSVLSFIIASLGIVETDASGILYSTIDPNSSPLQYSYHNIPYALGYSYIHSPYILPYPSYPAVSGGISSGNNVLSSTGIHNLKHHHPDHKDNDETNEAPIIAAAGSTSTESSDVENDKNEEKLPDASNLENNNEEKEEKTEMKNENNQNNGKSENNDDNNNNNNGENNVHTNAPNGIPLKASQLKHYKFSYPIPYAVPTPLYVASSSQFHHQDNLGHYYYGYASPDSSKQELKSIDDITRGTYSYVDANGKLQTVYYLSDANGFRVVATNLPKSPEPINIPDSPDIELAKQEHYKAQQEALDRLTEANKNENSMY